MSLLQNEDFVLYQLRTAYLSSIKDGVGERLINVDSGVLNNPAFRAAGWVPNAADIKRTYSPPIPTAITSEYFQAPRSAGLKAPEGFGDDDDEGGMVTGGGSNDTVGPTLHAKRRRRKEQVDEDDSSDLSDESDDEEEAHRPANQLKFTKMPLRTRSGSSPIRGSALRNELDEAGGPSVMITSPSRPPDSSLGRGSLGAMDTVRGRPRRDTITSSEMSSENEFDNSTFRKRRVNPRKAATASQLLSQRIQDDEGQAVGARLEALHEGHESDSSLTSEFSGSADSGSLIGAGDTLGSSPQAVLATIPGLTSFNSMSPRKKREPLLPTLQALPPPRPISFVLPVSALTQALRAKEHKPSNPLQRFAVWNAASEAQQNPLYIRLYCPFSSKPSKAVELLIRKFNDKGEGPTVAEAIGYALHRYQEEKLEPALTTEKMNVNSWVMRMYDDGEVDDEFPPLTRNKPLKDFASNNARGMRPRAREKPWDEFALVEATQREVGENEKVTPVYTKEAATAVASQQDASEEVEEKEPLKVLPNRAKSFRNPITGPSFAPTATRKDTSNLADVPKVPQTHAASRMGAPRTITVHFTDENFNTKHIPVSCTTDTYIADIFDQVCRDLRLEKALYILKVSGSTTIAPPDRTVEALDTRMDLDLQRRRFIGDGVYGLFGSPGSSSPNAPLIISTGGAPKKTKKGERTYAAVSGHQLIDPLSKGHSAALALTTTGYYRRYAVLRKQPMSFASSTSRILALDNEYIHIMPGETGAKTGTRTGGGWAEAQGKTTTVHFSSVVGSKVSKKHPKMFRVIVFKERETKRYDFEASTTDEAVEIVREIKRGVERFQEGIV
ncbi:stress-activated map kinase-interacting protein-like protein [Cucurbitaria berberidis CBS 394.84]|uniref:Stress-activated map kinase-interacting protein-like protein n=1 Tax=Cucurbitaria berberidis CBS 394.84 TaxID=1168544 RepID=A0A9P4LAY7_9PLEO|nr:stress-activated map kinase-interacting protein-like protein [Cucurbitaria berberidis CBS 394.84]KAF1847669.1 stress-activated map kinase-interacting protein-like protein [Cucurbitaria berberidis CBS 394.84]